MEAANSTHRIYIQPSTSRRTGLANFGKSGPLYDAIYNGELIVWSSHQPFLDACRVLLADGITGPAEMWDHVRTFPRLRSTVEAAAKLTVSEGEGSPRFRSYKNGIAAMGRHCAGGD